MLTLSVIDTGPGIDEAAMATLFSPFNQADSGMSRRHGGTGLGLALSRKLAIMLGGNVTATSRKGEGSVFTIAIPVGVVACSKDISGVEQLSAAAAPGPSEEKLTGRVLVVEDGLDNQRLIGLLLRKLGLEVTIAENGLEGIKLLSQDRDPDRGLCNPCPYDLVLMDMQMPVLDGYTATARLRESGSTVAIVALTAHSLEGDRQRCLDAGCTDYATKPVDRARLASLCRRWLGKAHAVVGGELTDAAANS
jgi:CheY-like chemotaxis protein